MGADRGADRSGPDGVPADPTRRAGGCPARSGPGEAGGPGGRLIRR
jgi:hypothetical protein